MKKFSIIILSTVLLIGIISCKKKGCTDPEAINYSPSAEKDDGSCIYETTVLEMRLNYGGGERQHLDLFLPEGHTSETKTVVLIHGGAWCLGPLPGDKNIIFHTGAIDLRKELLAHGYAVAEIKYRLACYTEEEESLTGNSVFYINQMIADVEAALAMLKDQADDLSISSNEFALLGESAGGHIALMTALRSEDETIKTVISFYGPTLLDETEFKTNVANWPYSNFTVNAAFALSDQLLDCEQRTTGDMNIFKGLESLAGHPLLVEAYQPEILDTISPAHPHNLESNLPVLLMYGMSDNLVPHGHGDSLLTALNTRFGTVPGDESDFSSQHKLLKYNNCGHGWSGGSCNKAQIRTDVLLWLTEHF